MKGNEERRVVAARAGILLAIALGAIVCFGESIACSGAVDSSLVGEWQAMNDSGQTALWFFNSDGTCGETFLQGNTSMCTTDCQYTYSNGTLTVMNKADGGFVDSPNSTSYSVTVSSNTLTVSAPDGGFGELEFTRLNSNASSSCN